MENSENSSENISWIKRQINKLLGKNKNSQKNGDATNSEEIDLIEKQQIEINEDSPDANKTELEMQKGNEIHVPLQNKTFLERSMEKTKIFDELRNAVLEENITKELYVDLLYDNLHVGHCNEQHNASKRIDLLEDAFSYSKNMHKSCLDVALNLEKPKFTLNIRVIKTKNISSSKTCESFVTVSLGRDDLKKANIPTEFDTLKIEPDIQFSLPITKNPYDDTVFFDVWKLRGFKCCPKKKSVGFSKAPLNTIPATGLSMWYNLYKKESENFGKENRGAIKVEMNIRSDVKKKIKNYQRLSNEHRNLLKNFIYQELKNSQVADYCWCGKFTKNAELVIVQHQAQSGLTDVETAFAQWAVYTEVHQHHPLSFELFDKILDVLLNPILNKNLEEEINIFWESTRRLLPSCFDEIRNLRKKSAGDMDDAKHLTSALSILTKVSKLEIPKDFDLFPTDNYTWLKKTDKMNQMDIRGAIEQAVTIAVTEHFEGIVALEKMNDENKEEMYRHCIDMTEVILCDLQKAVEHHDQIFHENLNIQYAGMLYKFYDEKILALVKPVVTNICFLRTKISENLLNTIFELYSVLNRLAIFGKDVCLERTDYKLNDFHSWFHDVIEHVIKLECPLMEQIQKAIDSDNLHAVHSSLKYSSSAIDTLEIFYQFCTFWKHLPIKKAEQSHALASNIIINSCAFYAATMSKRIDELFLVAENDESTVTAEWCLAINNMEHIRQNIHSMIKDLDVDVSQQSELSSFQGQLDPEQCSEEIHKLIDEAIVKVIKKLNPAFTKYLTQNSGVSEEDQDSNSMDATLTTMKKSFNTLVQELNEDNFKRVLDAVSIEILSILDDLVQISLDKRRPPAFYANLRNTLKVMVGAFTQNQEELEKIFDTDLKSIDKKLELYGCETSDLIHKYYLERHSIQQNLEGHPLGHLKVECSFKKDDATSKKTELKINIISAELISEHREQIIDTFVKLKIYPKEKFKRTFPQTDVIKGTLLPKFEKDFKITLMDDQRHLADAIIMFSVILEGAIDTNFAESFLMFKDIAAESNDHPTDKNFYLTSTPEKNETLTSIIDALKLRVGVGDKEAEKFISSLRRKIAYSLFSRIIKVCKSSKIFNGFCTAFGFLVGYKKLLF